jgi:hypothetical protein
MGKNVRFIPTNMIQKLQLPSFSLIMRPLNFGK